MAAVIPLLAEYEYHDPGYPVENPAAIPGDTRSTPHGNVNLVYGSGMGEMENVTSSDVVQVASGTSSTLFYVDGTPAPAPSSTITSTSYFGSQTSNRFTISSSSSQSHLPPDSATLSTVISTLIWSSPTAMSTLTSTSIMSQSQVAAAAHESDTKYQSVAQDQLVHRLIIGSAVGVSVLILISIIVLTVCCRRRKGRRERQRLGREGERDEAGEGRTAMSQIEGGDGRQRAPSIMDMNMTAQDVRDVLSMPSPAVPGPRPPPLPPRPLTNTVSRSRSASQWSTDDSELDALATDGSSVHRSLSTRSLNTVSEVASSYNVDMGYDHPAFTLGARRAQNPFVDQSSSPSYTWDGTTPSSTWVQTPTYPAGPSSARPRLPSLQVVTHAESVHNDGHHLGRIPSSPVSFSSTHVSDESDGTRSAGLDHSISHSGALRRGTTIIQHSDSVTSPTTAQFNPITERSGRGRKEVHIPPSYSDVYGDLA